MGADIPLQDGVEIVRLINTRPVTDETRLYKLPQDDLQGLSVALEQREHEKGQHDNDHEDGRHAYADRVFHKEKHGNARKRSQPETDNLTLCHIENELGLDAGQVLGNRYISH